MESASTRLDPRAHEVSVVIPVYQGESTLPFLVETLARHTVETDTPGGRSWMIREVLLVHDHGPDRSDDVVRALEMKYAFVRPIWLSRNYGQHSATLAGMASSGSEWIVTMDEDGQHAAEDIGVLLDVALDDRASVVYAKSTNRPPHGPMRNFASTLAKRVVSRMTGNVAASDFQSFRLILGEIGRSVAAYAGSGVYLDIALSWVAGRTSTAPIEFHDLATRRSGYTLRKLAGHFWRLVLSSGTRGLRLVSAMGVLLSLVGVLLAVYFVIQRLADGDLPAGWASTVTIILIAAGAILFSLGVIAEYIGVAVNMAMGKPPYLIVSDQEAGPLGRARRAP